MEKEIEIMTNLEAMTESAKIMRKMAEDHKVDDNKPGFDIEKLRVEFEKDTGINREDWSDGLESFHGMHSPSKTWERSFSAWLIDVKINELKTMLISNAEKEDLIEVIGLASFDRIIQDGSAINLDGENFRRIRNTKKVDDILF